MPESQGLRVLRWTISINLIRIKAQNNIGSCPHGPAQLALVAPSLPAQTIKNNQQFLFFITNREGHVQSLSMAI